MSTVIPALFSTALGAALGYGYHRVVGWSGWASLRGSAPSQDAQVMASQTSPSKHSCSTGTCPITARWWTATLYGAVMGFMLAFRR